MLVIVVINYSVEKLMTYHTTNILNVNKNIFYIIQDILQNHIFL